MQNISTVNISSVVVGGILLLLLGIVIGWQASIWVNGGAGENATEEGATDSTPTSAGVVNPGILPKKTSTVPKSAPVSTSLTVRYTDAGFVPAILEIKAGSLVRFVNESSRTLWVKSVENKPPFIALNQGTSVGKGGSWSFLFPAVGTWGYKNDNYPTHKGAVAVMPQ